MGKNQVFSQEGMFNCLFKVLSHSYTTTNIFEHEHRKTEPWNEC